MGGLLNVTFGNAAEMISGFIALSGVGWGTSSRRPSTAQSSAIFFLYLGVYFMEPMATDGKCSRSVMPAHANRLLIRADVPGIDPKDVDISVSGNNFVIRARRESKKEDKGRRYYCREISYGKAHQACVLDHTPRIVAERSFVHRATPSWPSPNGSANWPRIIPGTSPSPSRSRGEQ